MAAPALVQDALGASGGQAPVTLASPPTAGNLLLLWKSSNGPVPVLTTGFTDIDDVVNSVGNVRRGRLMYRIAQPGDSATFSAMAQNDQRLYVQEWSGAEVYSSASQDSRPSSAPFTCGGSVTPETGVPSTVVGFANIFQGSNEPDVASIAPSASVTETEDTSDGGTHGVTWAGYRAIASPSGSYTVGGTTTGEDARAISYCGITVVLGSTESLAPVADFEADEQLGAAPLTVVFTDLSTNTPTSWLWDFGDGDTSTTQHPSHVYDSPGTYTVSLTATNAAGSDTETKVAFIETTTADPYTPPLPAGPLIEIYVAETGAARWDVATWDDAVWSTGAWQDVTPQSVDARIVWGSIAAEMGILSKSVAGAWAINTYDPNRLLDPANADGPYYTDLVPFLPIRVSHRGVVIRQGIAETIGFDYETDQGLIRVMDNIALLANAMVPPDVDLSDTLYARAVDAIAAAGLAVTVLGAPPSGDPAVAPWVTATNDWSAWEWIRDAAEQVLHIAYVDRLGRLGFRPYASPLARGRTLDATELVGLASIAQYNGLYSVIRALDEDGINITERVLPPPRYGLRVYERTSTTIDSGAWADAVLADRSFSALRWIPGTVYPLTAASVEAFSTIEAVELVGLTHAYTDPSVLANLIVVGGEIEITAKADDEAKWWFTFEAAQTPLAPLSTEDAGGFLTNEAGSEYLYPD